MKNILLLAVIALIGTAAQAQTASGDTQNETMNKPTSVSDTAAKAAVIGDSKCPECELKNLSQAKMLDKTAAPQRSGSSGSSDRTQGQEGAQ